HNLRLPRLPAEPPLKQGADDIAAVVGRVALRAATSLPAAQLVDQPRYDAVGHGAGIGADPVLDQIGRAGHAGCEAADAAAQPGEHLQRLLGVGENAGYVGIDPGAGKRALDEDGHAKPGHVEIAALPVQRSHHAWIEPHADRLLRQIDAAFAAHAHERAEQAQIPGPGDAVLDIERNGKLRELGFPGSVLVVAAA